MESGERPDTTPPEEDARGGRGPDSEGDGGKRGTVGIPWLTAGPDGKHSGVKGGPNLSPPRPPKTNTTSKLGKTLPNTSATTTKTFGPNGPSKPILVGPSGPSKHITSASTEASKPNSRLTPPSKPNSKNMTTSTPKRGDIPIRETTIDLTCNPEDTIVIDDYLGPRRTTPDGFVLRPDGKLFNEKTGQIRIPTTEERLAWRILERQEEERLKKMKNPPQRDPVENAQERLKRNASQLSQDSTNPGTDPKKTKPNETKTDDKTDSEEPRVEKEVGYWNTDAVRLLTVRVISATGEKLTNNDLNHIGQYHMKACFHNFGTDVDKWDDVAADRVSLVTPFTFAKFKIRTSKGVQFWKDLIPQIPTTTNVETTGAYAILLPGETMFEELFFSIAFAQLALGEECDLKMLETAIRVGNPLLRKTRFRLKSTGIDKTSNKTGIIMELLSTDRERCFGPKPADPTESPKWKLRISFSTVNVTVAYGKTEKKRQDRARAMEAALARPPPPPPPPPPKPATPTETTTPVETPTSTETPTKPTENRPTSEEMTEDDVCNIMLDDDGMDEDVVVETEEPKGKVDESILDTDEDEENAVKNAT